MISPAAVGCKPLLSGVCFRERWIIREETRRSPTRLLVQIADGADLAPVHGDVHRLVEAQKIGWTRGPVTVHRRGSLLQVILVRSPTMKVPQVRASRGRARRAAVSKI